MTSSAGPTRCAVCEHDLTPADRFCSGCGSPTPTGATGGSAGDAPDAMLAEYEADLRARLADEFALLETIGHGGFARVFKARDRRLDRLVALKVIRPDFAGATTFVDRFRREGIALARLRHPGIIPIYDIRDLDGVVYYVMPYVEGETLRERIERLGKLPPFEAHRILMELTDAIRATHRAGFVHRDIKPSNVILEGSLRKALLMDFGIAKTLVSRDEQLTEDGVLVGTPAYMSPEQAAGEPVDERSDIYALGVLGYHMVVGELPFGGETSQELLAQHMTERPVPVRDRNPSVPKGYSDAVMKCLAKEPDERHQDAAHLWDDLRVVSFHAPRPKSAPSRPSPLPSLRLAAVLGFVGVLVGLALGTLLDDGTSPAEPRGESAAVLSTGANRFAMRWINATRRLERAPAGAEDSFRGPVSAVFDSTAVIMVGEDDSLPARQLTPAELVRDSTAIALLARLQGRGFAVRLFGDVALAEHAPNAQTSCGRVQLVLQRRDASWVAVYARVEPRC